MYYKLKYFSLKNHNTWNQNFLFVLFLWEIECTTREIKERDVLHAIIYMCHSMLWWMWSKQLYLSHVAVIISARGGAVIHCSIYWIGNHNRNGARGNECCFKVFATNGRYTHIWSWSNVASCWFLYYMYIMAWRWLSNESTNKRNQSFIRCVLPMNEHT